MTIQEGYTIWSETYDADTNRTRDLDAQITALVLGNRRFASILELGCGTGKNTALLATIGGTVRAVDFSEGMIARAKARISAPNVTFAAANIAEPWDALAESFDLVVCNLVLEHLEHLSPVFAEAHRALSQRGTFFLSELHPFRQYDGSVANFSQGGTATEIPAFLHNVSDFVTAAQGKGFAVQALQEWWHDDDAGQPPRLLSFLFTKGTVIEQIGASGDISKP
ncbi:MAG: class I SAM-dependent methyltransferase [Armatimonadetes bacterium]|nr:class I SAM-dependent methyltransferase [Armatimonadota bacterium]